MGVAELNQALAVGSALFLVGMPVWLKIKRKIGSITTLLIALCFFALSHVLIGVLIWEQQADPVAISAPAILLISRIFYGIGGSAIVPIVQAWASSIANSDARLGLLQKISAHLILGRIIGPVIALPLLSIWPPLTILLVLFLALCVGISLCKLIKGDVRLSEKVSPQYKQKPNLKTWVRALGRYVILAASLQSLVGIVQFSFSIWLMETFQWEAENVAIYTGSLLMSCGVLVAVAQLYIKPSTQAFSSVLRVLTFFTTRHRFSFVSTAKHCFIQRVQRVGGCYGCAMGTNLFACRYRANRIYKKR